MNYRIKINQQVLMFFLSILINGCQTQTHHEIPVTVVEVGFKKEDCEKNVIDTRCSSTVTSHMDSTGKLWIIWVQGNQIYLQTTADKGNTFTKPIGILSQPEPISANGEYRPKLVTNDNGQLFVTWTTPLEKKHTGNIRFSHSDDNGQTFSKPITINDNRDVISHRFDDILIGKNGEVFIAWLDARDKEKAKVAKEDFLGTAVYYTWSKDAGKTFAPNKLVAPHTCECCRVSIAIDNDNLPVVMWRHVFEGNIRDHALVKFKNWSTPGELKRATHDEWKIEACPHHGPSLAIDAKGRYHTVWFNGSSDQAGLYYSHSHSKGKRFDTPLKFGDAGAKHPHIGVAEDKVAIVWSEYDGINNLLKGMISDDHGENWSEVKTLGSTKGNADYGFVVSDGENLYFSWQTAEAYLFKPID